MNGIKTNSCHLKYLISDYIEKLYNPEDEVVYAIGDLIEDLHKDKIMTASHIINQADIELLICQFLKLLRASLPTIVGNTAYILGTLAEFEDGRSKIIHILSLEDSDKQNSFDFLISLLDTEDTGTLLNVTGTIGSLVESSEGRDFILSRTKCLATLLSKVNHILSSSDLWIASNAALIIARITIDEDGNLFLLNSPLLSQIIVNLVVCLSIDTAGRGMNAAFALGRIFDNGSTIETYHVLIHKMKFIEKLVIMTECNEMAFVKNACFCISSILGSDKGYGMVITDSLFDQLISNLERILSLHDDETVWFGILTLKIISKKPSGCKLLRNRSNFFSQVKKCMHDISLSDDVRKECQEIINNLTPLEKPPRPNVTLISSYEVLVSWTYPKLVNYLEINSFLYYKQDDDEVLAYKGKKHEISIKNLEPNQKYEFYLKFANVIEITIPSDSCTVLTAEDYPSEPTNLHVITVTSTQIKIGWDEPEKTNGTVKHYVIQMTTKNEEDTRFGNRKSKQTFELTNGRTTIVSGLLSETEYSFSVSAVNSCGRGKPAEVDACTLSSGAHSPDRPNVIMLGRSVAHLTWNPPESMLGKFFRYDVKMNQKIKVYSGIHTYCKITNLKPDTEYSFSVIAVTSEGKFEGPICRKRSGKDEYAGSHRAPLYEPKMKPESGDCPTSNRTVSSFNLPIHSTKTKRNSIGGMSSHNSDVETNHKPLQPTPVVNSIRLPAQNLEYPKAALMTSRESIMESSKKLQPIIPSQYKSKSGIIKPMGDSISLMSGYTNSMSIPSLSSIDIDAQCNPIRKSSEITAINIRSGDKAGRSELLSNMSTNNGRQSQIEQSDIVDRCQFRKVPVKTNVDVFKIPLKNTFVQTKSSILQRKQSNVLQ